MDTNIAAPVQKIKHPKELYRLSLVLFWDRFGYYGIIALLIAYELLPFLLPLIIRKSGVKNYTFLLLPLVLNHPVNYEVGSGYTHPLNDSMYGLSVGLPGLEKSKITLFS